MREAVRKCPDCKTPFGPLTGKCERCGFAFDELTSLWRRTPLRLRQSAKMPLVVELLAHHLGGLFYLVMIRWFSRTGSVLLTPDCVRTSFGWRKNKIPWSEVETMSVDAGGLHIRRRLEAPVTVSSVFDSTYEGDPFLREMDAMRSRYGRKSLRRTISRLSPRPSYS